MAEWREQDHPRDEDGKFTNKKTESYKVAVSKEKRITEDVQNIANAIGSKVVGLEFRIKSYESYARKVEKDAKDYLRKHPDKTMEQAVEYAVGHMYDTVRYTSVSSPEEFTRNYQRFITNLKGMGYTVSRVKNSIHKTDAAYRGINAVVTAPGGFHFEVQFHTPQSFQVKQETHPMYEEARLPTTSEARKLELKQKMMALTKSIQIPACAETILSFDYL